MVMEEQIHDWGLIWDYKQFFWLLKENGIGYLKKSLDPRYFLEYVKNNLP